MVNLSTVPDVMVREIIADRAKASYWLKKHFGGEKGYEKMRDNLILQCRRDKRNHVSETVEYHSANGNRWMTYECARYYKEADMVYTEPYAFCFYETLGSVGAFVPVKLGSDGRTGRDAVLLFNSHFFHQMSERLELGFRSPEMVRAFHEFIPSLLVSMYEEEGRKRILVRLPGSIGFGFKKEGEAHVFEVRTFLKDTQLNGKQLRLTETIRLNAGKFMYEPKDIKRARAKKTIKTLEDAEAELQRLKERYMLLGMKEEDFNRTFRINFWIVTVFVKMGLGSLEDGDFWDRHCANNIKLVYQFVRDGKFDNELIYDLIARCAENNGYKNFDKEKAKKVLWEEYRKRYSEK